MTTAVEVGVEPGDTVRVTGLRGEFRLISWRSEPGGLVANVVGGARGYRMFRSVTSDRIRVVRRRIGGPSHGS